MGQVHFYNGPRVTSVAPSYGVTKQTRADPANPEKKIVVKHPMEIAGENFVCPRGEGGAEDCTRVKVRFTNKQTGVQIFEDATMTTQGNIRCEIPAYPAPETFYVDVSLNGLDYSNDKATFGFIDPFILAVEPRLISAKGGTTISLKGYGFVRQEEGKMQTQWTSENATLTCGSGACTAPYSVVSEKLCTVVAFPQSEVTRGTKNIGFEPINIEMAGPDGGFDHNDIDVWYYKDPVLKGISSQFAYINERKPLILATDFFWGDGNDATTFQKYANATCRFTSEKTGHQVVTTALIEANPIGSGKTGKLPD